MYVSNRLFVVRIVKYIYCVFCYDSVPNYLNNYRGIYYTELLTLMNPDVFMTK